MTEQEISKLKTMHNAAIIAPAGHGKTEMIAEMVKSFSGKQLVLTHTNAGIDVLSKRFKKHKIQNDRFTIDTIAAFCLKWCNAYYHSASFDTSLSPFSTKEETKSYYTSLYEGTKKIFDHTWAGQILQATYTGIIVDEYQDCTLTQHAIIQSLNNFLPVRILGDPLQGIFDFEDPLVDWNNIGYELLPIGTSPWRWINSNPNLGSYLDSLRTELLPLLSGRTGSITIKPKDNVLKIIPASSFNIYKYMGELSQFDKVLYLAQWERNQLQFCKSIPGVFQHDEKQDCDTLFKYASAFSTNQGPALALVILKFMSECCTQVSAEANSFIKNLQKGKYNFSKIKKCEGLGACLVSICETGSFASIISTLEWFKTQSVFKFYRKELYHEMLRSIRYASTHNTNLYDAALHIRKDVGLQKKYTEFKYLSSRTLLSKGLEFDCVIIDMRVPLSAKNYYVAATRATKKIYVITDNLNIPY